MWNDRLGLEVRDLLESRAMAYQVIARKYRPQKFSDVVGQEHVIRTLRNAITSGRIAHAYLFAGPRGTGKTTLARIFSKALNCQNGPNAEFADDDPICQDIADGTCLDVIEIDGASNNGVDQIRDLRDTVQYTPNAARFKIYIIDEVHMLSTQAFNALLKTLEEPPSHVKFMFATTEPDKILPTILSRCQRFDLTSIPVEKIASHLKDIAAQESIHIDEVALNAIARSADGGMRDAESTLDQLISFCGDSISETDVLGMFGLTGRDQIVAMTDAILSADATAALKNLDQLVRNGKDLTRLLADLLNHFRNLLVFNISKGDGSLLQVSELEVEHIRRQAAAATPDQLTRIIESMAEFEMKLKQFSSRKIALELCLVRAIEARKAIDLNHVLTLLRKLEEGEPLDIPVQVLAPPPLVLATTAAADVKSADAPMAEAAKEPPPAPAPAVAAAEVAQEVPSATPIEDPLPDGSGGSDGSDGSDEPELDWNKLVERAGKTSAFLATVLNGAHLSRFNARLLVIGMDPAISSQIALSNTPKNIKAIQAALKEQGFAKISVEFVEEPHPSGKAPAMPELEEPRPRTRSTSKKRASGPDENQADSDEPIPVQPIKLDPEEFRNDPLIQEALEIFKGQIVEVRRSKD